MGTYLNFDEEDQRKIIENGLIGWIIIYLLICALHDTWQFGFPVFLVTTILALAISGLTYGDISNKKQLAEPFYRLFDTKFHITKSIFKEKYQSENFTDEELAYIAAIKTKEDCEYEMSADKRFISERVSEKELLKKYSIQPFAGKLQIFNEIMYKTKYTKKVVGIKKKEVKSSGKMKDETVMKLEEQVQTKTNSIDRSDDVLHCFKCGSSQLSANKKGFGFGKAAVGGLLTGGVGLLGGFIGSRKVKITCLRCGYSWTAGK